MFTTFKTQNFHLFFYPQFYTAKVYKMPILLAIKQQLFAKKNVPLPIL
jgi:hypothetical protein